MDSRELGPLTRNAFLGGALTISQPLNGYRAGIDPVLLAASIPAKRGQSVLDLGCGSGVAALCLGRRVSDLKLYGLEVQSGYAALARQNGTDNDLAFEVFEGSVEAPPSALNQLTFDHVIANPPYFKPEAGTSATDAGRDLGRAGQTDLRDWVGLARKRLKPGGFLTLIQDAARMPEIVSHKQSGFGGITVLPIAPRTGRAARLVIVQARKNSAAQPRLLAPLILHEGAEHVSDGDDYTEVASKILRDGVALSL